MMTMDNRALIAVLVCALFASSTIVAGAYAQTTIPTPSVPEFSLKLSEHSSEIPITQSIDPYTGENITHLGSHYEWKTLEISIKNQPAGYELHYRIRTKGHFSQEWTTLVNPTQNSNERYTIVTFIIKNPNNPPSTSDLMQIGIPNGGQADFQIQAEMGYEYRDPQTSWYTYTGTVSGWSNTQTITIPEPSPSESPSPSQTSTQTASSSLTPFSTRSPSPSLTPLSTIPEFPTVIAIPLVLAATLLIIYERKKE
jgi:hypothetical protein